MTKLQFVLTLPDADLRDEEAIYNRFEPLRIALEALTQINEWHLREALSRGTPLPRLYDSGVRYEEEPPGQEDWLDIPTLYRLRKGDCEDLGCALAAERRVYDGIPASPYIKSKFIPSKQLLLAGYPRRDLPKEGIHLVHVMTILPDGTVEDPSKVLGMQGEYS